MSEKHDCHEDGDVGCLLWIVAILALLFSCDGSNDADEVRRDLKSDLKGLADRVEKLEAR